MTNNKLTQELKECLQWGKEKADWCAPLIEKEDELFDEVGRDTLEVSKQYW
ncbi:hypothetical protein [Mangrovimonas cancribranchiae]|uniref:Uncharacterized protein n=1 Tax=Mangrovimonas cancribranchiae TaxID=3080055 RepID=A0AAU6NXM8_9FLAO